MNAERGLLSPLRTLPMHLDTLPIALSMLRDMVVSNGVKTLVSAKVTQITDSSVIAETPDGSTSVACDTVLLAMGWASDADSGKELESICSVIPIGDSNKCRNILAATSEAYDAVKSIC